jgi:hypothetical protein
MDSTAGAGQSGESAEAGSEGDLVFNESEGGMDGAGSQGGDSDALPDFSEEEVLNEALESFEEAMESAAAEGQSGQQGGFPGSGEQGSDAQAQGAESGGASGSGSQTADAGQAGDGAGGSGSQTADAGQSGDGANGGMQGEQGGTGASGFPAGSPAGRQGSRGGGSGTLTDAEQVAILDEQLNRGTGEFDDLILKEREVLRRTARGGSEAGQEEAPAGSGGYGSAGGSGGFQVPPMAGGGGGGQGGPLPSPREGDYDQDIPEQVAVYAPPADIPDGTDDDVVARQLREAAMREPDPQLREKLWDEYRKYKGIE